MTDAAAPGPRRRTIAGAPEGADALYLAGIATTDGPPLVHVCRDDRRLERLAAGLDFLAPEVTVLALPAWDCRPYDRASPNPEIVSRRVDTLARLAANGGAAANGAGGQATILLTTASAILQRLPPPAMFRHSSMTARTGGRLDLDALTGFLTGNGYNRTGTVREHGEFAIRGGIVDLWPPGTTEPLRLDLFGDELETVRRFDPLSQRTTGETAEFTLGPVSEILLDDDAITRFRTGYRELFGAGALNDAIYESITAGRRYPGMEHWLPLFHEELVTLFDWLPDSAVLLDHQIDEAVTARLDLIEEYHSARLELSASPARGDDTPAWRPVPPARMFLDRDEWERAVATRPGGMLSPFVAPPESDAIDAGGRPGPNLAAARTGEASALFDAVGAWIGEQRTAGRRVLVAAWSTGSRDRLAGLLHEHGIPEAATVDSAAEARKAGAGRVAVAVLGLETGFLTDDLAVLTEQDILGDRLARPAAAGRRRGADFLTEASTLNDGDLVVHAEHGIGRYESLETLEVDGAPHDCLRLSYAGDDRLFVPVENIDVLSRFGSADSAAQLDRLGGAAWQARKAKVRERILEIAAQLLKVAAERQLRRGEAMEPPAGAFDEFCARFPWPETDDQQRAIGEVLEDIASGRPMDRLICGDVGFGKTEVALRAAFTAVMTGAQVAVVVPTTLLARQHFATFVERFRGFPVHVGQISRLVSARDQQTVRAGLEDGSIDIVIGTHALLGTGIKFRRLGLLVVDEEQHFGVAQKERLKRLRTDVHVLTLTATPIPRTLQMALAGVRELSIIATPPVDRLAVRTFVLPWDPVVVREAILRERFRGGQTFCVCPRVRDIERLRERLLRLVPDLKLAVAHGGMPARQLEDVMTAFCDGGYELLLSTNIIESGLDIPTVNTLIVHRAEMFGLSQLYQLRGRIGRSRTRAWAYLTLPPDRAISKTAEARLHVMQTLDSLGAGFTLASHDMDIRGAGNLLGEEQSGHIREVGIELYQHMLEEAVAEARDGKGMESAAERDWSPQISLGMPVLVPETYVADLPVRLGLYRRIAGLVDAGETDALAAEMVDRFGTLPAEVENLLRVVAIKRHCLTANIARLDAGPKGAVLAFREDRFADPAGLVQFIGEQAGSVKLRPDHRLVYRRQWDDAGERIRGAEQLVRKLAAISEKKQGNI